MYPDVCIRERVTDKETTPGIMYVDVCIICIIEGQGERKNARKMYLDVCIIENIFHVRGNSRGARIKRKGKKHEVK